jgi:FkbM family methyltransferase
VHGFDSIEEVVRQLTETNRGRSNRHYHFMAVGNSDGEMRFYFNPGNPTASSMFPQGASRYGVETVEQVRNVPVRRLDSLLAEGTIPRADFSRSMLRDSRATSCWVRSLSCAPVFSAYRPRRTSG